MIIYSLPRSTGDTPASSIGTLGRSRSSLQELHDFAHIREVQVMKKFRRQGVGKKLTRYALHRLKALGIRNILLATAETNKVARRLYESVGFKQYRREVYYHLRINGSSRNDS